MTVRRAMTILLVTAAAFLSKFGVCSSSLIHDGAAARGSATLSAAAAVAPVYTGMTAGIPCTRSSQIWVGGGMLREAPWTRALATSAAGGITPSDQGFADPCSSSMLSKAWWTSSKISPSSGMLSATWIRGIELSTEDNAVLEQVCPFVRAQVIVVLVVLVCCSAGFNYFAYTVCSVVVYIELVFRGSN